MADGMPRPRAPAVTPLLEIDGLSKSFGTTRALDAAWLRIMSGRVHGLVGQNGSGKSTLVKVLSGYHEPEPGARIVVDGKEATRALGAGGSRALGLRFVHQDLGLVGGLSVTENLLVDRFVGEPRAWLRWRAEHAKAADLLASFGVRIDPRRTVGELPAAVQAMVAIVRAAEGLRANRPGAGSRGILVLDEATASLPLAARDQLQSVVRAVVALGHSVLFVSHFPDEVLEWADQVTVLRDGRVVADRPTEGMTEDELVELIIGRRMETHHGGPASVVDDGAAPSVRVTGLCGHEVEELSFEVRPGEVLGVTGLVGSGFDEVTRVLGGAGTARGGVMELDGRTWSLPAFSPVSARRAGVSFVPHDRQRLGAAPALTVSENISLAILDRFRGAAGRIRHRRLRQEVRRLLEDYGVRPPDPNLALGNLSGGNQQKVVIAKAMASLPRVLLLDEPTQGVDVGARAEILGKLRDVARSGTAVVCATTDASQLEELCDRVVVLRRGRLCAELTGDAINEDRIVEETYSSVS
jgi:ribose transport system ATP-binding protein